MQNANVEPIEGAVVNESVRSVNYAIPPWFFGVFMQNVQYFDPTFQQFFRGVQVTSVIQGTPAASRVEPGDIITRVEGNRVETIAQFSQALRASQNGSVSMRVRDIRTGGYVDFQVQLLAHPQFNTGTGPGPVGP